MNNRNDLPGDDADWKEILISVVLLAIIILMAISCHAQVALQVTR